MEIQASQRNDHPPPQPRQCLYCMGMYSYSNFASHSKRCKVRLGQNISATNDEVDILRNDNAELRRERDDWALRYKEVKDINDKLINKLPKPTEVVRMD